MRGKNEGRNATKRNNETKTERPNENWVGEQERLQFYGGTFFCSSVGAAHVEVLARRSLLNSIILAMFLAYSIVMFQSLNKNQTGLIDMCMKSFYIYRFDAFLAHFPGGFIKRFCSGIKFGCKGQGRTDALGSCEKTNDVTNIPKSLFFSFLLFVVWSFLYIPPRPRLCSLDLITQT